MDGTPILRDLAPGDGERIRQLVLDGLREHWGEVDASLNPDLDDLAAAHPGSRTVVADLGGEVVGTGTLVPRGRTAAEIVRMAVAADHRGGGLGRRMVEDLLATARRWSMASVVLETSSHWTGAVAFYLACGFEVTGEQEGAFGRDTWFERRL